jgi:hypothetical protein
MHRLVNVTDRLQDIFTVFRDTVDRHADAVIQLDRALGECGQADDTPARYHDSTWVAWTRTPPRCIQFSATHEQASDAEVSRKGRRRPKHSLLEWR